MLLSLKKFSANFAWVNGQLSIRLEAKVLSDSGEILIPPSDIPLDFYEYIYWVLLKHTMYLLADIDTK